VVAWQGCFKASERLLFFISGYSTSSFLALSLRGHPKLVVGEQAYISNALLACEGTLYRLHVTHDIAVRFDSIPLNRDRPVIRNMESSQCSGSQWTAQLLVDGAPNVAIVIAELVSDDEVVWSGELKVTSSADRVLRPYRQITTVRVSATIQRLRSDNLSHSDTLVSCHLMNAVPCNLIILPQLPPNGRQKSVSLTCYALHTNMVSNFQSPSIFRI